MLRGQFALATYRLETGRRSQRQLKQSVIVPRNLGTFAHDTVRGIGRALKKRPRQISCANQLGNEANRRGQWGVRDNHIFAPDRVGVKTHT